MSSFNTTNLALLNAAGECAQFRKMPMAFRQMFSHLANGGRVDISDLEQGLMHAMQCCTTAAGQSMARRKAAEPVRLLWNAVTRGPDNGDATLTRVAYPETIVQRPTRPDPNALPDLSVPVEVEQWLAR